MTQEKTDDFKPFSKWKPFHTMTFVDYEFTINGNNIELDERILPEQLNVKAGDKFIVQITELGRVILVKE